MIKKLVLFCLLTAQTWAADTVIWGVNWTTNAPRSTNIPLTRYPVAIGTNGGLLVNLSSNVTISGTVSADGATTTNILIAATNLLTQATNLLTQATNVAAQTTNLLTQATNLLTTLINQGTNGTGLVNLNNASTPSIALSNFLHASFEGCFTNTTTNTTNAAWTLSGQPYVLTNFFKVGCTNDNIITYIAGMLSTNGLNFDLWICSTNVVLGTNGSYPNLTAAERRWLAGPIQVRTNNISLTGQTNYHFAINTWTVIHPCSLTNRNVTIYRVAASGSTNEVNTEDWFRVSAIQE